MNFRLVMLFFLFSVGVFSQEKYIKHTISKGENITSIAKKYGVKPKAIIEANPESPKILKLNSVLLIPNSPINNVPDLVEKTVNDEKIVNTVSTTVHEVLAKETLWGISRQYKVTVADLKKANPLLVSDGLKVGRQIIIPSADVKSKAEDAEVAVATEKVEKEVPVEIVREVLAKETKYAIAKEFGITVAELEKQNPEIKAKLPIGYKLKILASKEKAIAYQTSNPVQVADNTINKPALKLETSPIKLDTTAIKWSNQSDLIEQLIVTATDNIGSRYRTGGTTKAGFDCSGLIVTTFNNFDIKLPRSSIEQSKIGVKVNSDEAQKGDLIFFKTNGRRQINHVGMVIEVTEDEIKFVHSSTQRGVIISSTKEGYYQRNFSQVNRILQ